MPSELRELEQIESRFNGTFIKSAFDERSPRSASIRSAHRHTVILSRDDSEVANPGMTFLCAAAAGDQTGSGLAALMVGVGLTAEHQTTTPLLSTNRW